jgi:Tfp pilus assembly protein PilW
MQLHHDSSGVTLIEQLVALLLGTVIIASLYEFYRAELFRTISQEAKTSTLEDARGALDIIVRDLRNAGSWGTGSAPPERGGADDLNNDADTDCNRVYAASRQEWFMSRWILMAMVAVQTRNPAKCTLRTHGSNLDVPRHDQYPAQRRLPGSQRQDRKIR